MQRRDNAVAAQRQRRCSAETTPLQRRDNAVATQEEEGRIFRFLAMNTKSTDVLGLEIVLSAHPHARARAHTHTHTDTHAHIRTT